MSQINPFIGSAVQATGVQLTQAAEKDRQLRRTADTHKDSALQGDRFEHAVESDEELATIHDEEKENPQKRRRQHGQHPDSDSPEDPESHVDVTA